MQPVLIETTWCMGESGQPFLWIGNSLLNRGLKKPKYFLKTTHNINSITAVQTHSNGSIPQFSVNFSTDEDGKTSILLRHITNSELADKFEESFKLRYPEVTIQKEK